MPFPGVPDLSVYIANQAKQDLAERLDVDVSDIDLTEQEQVEWSDSSLGCPQTGLAYLPVVTPGYRIIFEIGGKQHIYHTDLREQIVYCVDGKPVN
jgi:hypothetical protein